MLVVLRSIARYRRRPLRDRDCRRSDGARRSSRRKTAAARSCDLNSARRCLQDRRRRRPRAEPADRRSTDKPAARQNAALVRLVVNPQRRHCSRLRDAIAHRLLRNVEPDREIERRADASAESPASASACGTVRGKPSNTKPYSPCRSQPVFDQLDDDVVGHQSALLGDLIRLQPERRPQVAFAPQDRAGRGDRNPKLPGDHFGLRSLSGTGRAEKHDVDFSLVSRRRGKSPRRRSPSTAIADVEPHQRRPAAPLRRERSSRDRKRGHGSGPCAGSRRNAAESGASPPAASCRA